MTLVDGIIGDINPSPRPGPGSTFEVESYEAASSHRVRVANVREAHRVTITMSPPRVAVGAYVGDPPGPFWNRYVKSGVGEVIIDVAVSGNLAVEPIVVPFVVSGGTAGVHYTLPGGSSITIPVGATTGRIRIAFPSQASYFQPREIRVTLGDVTGASVNGQTYSLFHLRPSAAAPTVQFTSATSSGSEGGGALTATLELSAASLSPTTVYLEVDEDASTASAADYTLSATRVTIPAGQTTATVTVTPVDDAAVEVAEAVVLAIANDDRTTRVNYWNHTAKLHVTEGPLIQTDPFAGYPTDNLYKGNNSSVGWTLVPREDGLEPDGRAKAYRYGVSAGAIGSSKIGKSFKARSADSAGRHAGGPEQFLPLEELNVLSLYVKKPDAQNAAPYFGMQLYDRTQFVETGEDASHKAIFRWNGDTPELVYTEGL